MRTNKKHAYQAIKGRCASRGAVGHDARTCRWFQTTPPEPRQRCRRRPLARRRPTMRPWASISARAPSEPNS